MPVLVWLLVGTCLVGIPSRAPVTGSSTMVQPTCVCFDFAAAASSAPFLRVEHAGFLELAIPLELP